jgi:methyl-accepting chemotaxis protein
MDKIKAFFLGRYYAEKPVEQRQIGALFYTLLSIVAGCLAISLALKDAAAIKTAVLILIAVAIVLVFLIKAGFASIVGIMTSLLISLLFVAIPFLQRFRGEYELYLITALQCLALFITGIIARKAWQPFAIMAIALAAILVDYVARVEPATGQLAHVSDLVTSTFIIVVSTFIEQALRKRDAMLLAIAEEEGRQQKSQVEKLRRVIVSSRDALGFGADVTQSAEKTASLIGELKHTLSGIEAEVNALIGSSAAIRESHGAISSSSRTVNDRVTEQSAIVSQSSSAIEEMSASVGNIAEIAMARKEAIAQLKATTEAGAGEMTKAREAMRLMSESAKSIAEVVNVIRAVASKTNLLAMNAAIEAAHAGEAGKGFSVVASEIRTLSEETNRNVKLINANIKGTMEAVKTASAVNEGAQAIFLRVDGEADAVAKAMEEIDRGLKEISAGSGEILQGVSQSVSITSSVRDSAAAMGTTIAAASEKLAGLDSSAQNVRQSLSEAVRRFDAMLAEAKAMGEAGKKNELGLQELADALKGLEG